MKILKVNPGEKPFVKEMDDTLDAIQSEVEGCFEIVYMEHDVALCCNDEGKLNGMAMNRRIGNDIICGPFFLVGIDQENEGEFCSLPEEKITEYSERFKEPEQFADFEPDAQPFMRLISF